jgi:hypothetical protein
MLFLFWLILEGAAGIADIGKGLRVSGLEIELGH